MYNLVIFYQQQVLDKIKTTIWPETPSEGTKTCVLLHFTLSITKHSDVPLKKTLFGYEIEIWGEGGEKGHTILEFPRLTNLTCWFQKLSFDIIWRKSVKHNI